MKRILALVCCVILMGICLVSCSIDPYSGKRPYDYGAAKWVCEDPQIWFVVDPDADVYYDPKGEIQVGDRTYSITLYFVDGSKTVLFDIAETDYELEGECEFYPDKLVVKVDKKRSTLFDGKYEELIFNRTEN